MLPKHSGQDFIAVRCPHPPRPSSDHSTGVPSENSAWNLTISSMMSFRGVLSIFVTVILSLAHLPEDRTSSKVGLGASVSAGERSAYTVIPWP